MPENIQSFRNSEIYMNAFISLMCFLPVCMLISYFCIYWIIPKYLNKGLYLTAIFAFVSLFIIGLPINHFTSLFYFDNAIFKDSDQNPALISLTNKNLKNVLELSYHNLIWAACIALIVLGIKFSKNWYLQQQENLMLMQKRIRDEIHLKKVQIQPEYLSEALKTIHQQINKDSDNAPAVILKLSELLSYSLYESRERLVPLKKEISALKNYLSLQKAREDRNIKVRINLNPTGKFENQVPPMLILSILQDSVMFWNTAETNPLTISLTINTDNNKLDVDLSLRTPATVSKGCGEAIYAKAQQNLDLLLEPSNYKIQLFQNDHEIRMHFNIFELMSFKINPQDKGHVYEPA